MFAVRRAARQVRSNSLRVRYYSSAKSSTDRFPSLPALSEWPQVFPSGYNSTRSTLHVDKELRIFLHNQKTAGLVVKNLGIADEGEPKTIIEAYPGPGVLTRALLSLPPSKLRRLIVLEKNDKYLPCLHELAKVDDRLVVVPQSPYEWDTYVEIERLGLLSHIPTATWDQVHPSLRFVSQLPLSVSSEKLISQLIRAIAQRSWLFQYGRVPMHILCAQWIYTRLTVKADTNTRCKLSVIAQASTAISRPLKLEPYGEHFYPKAAASFQNVNTAKNPSIRSPGHPYLGITITPRESGPINPDNASVWDYILRNMFIQKGSNLTKVLPFLGAGAGPFLFKTLAEVPKEQRLDLTRLVKSLEVEDFAKIVDAFQKWPFAPSNLDLDIPSSA